MPPPPEHFNFEALYIHMNQTSPGIVNRDGVQGSSSSGCKQLFCAWLYFTQYLFDFAPHLSNRIEILAVGRKKTLPLAFADYVASILRLMGAKTVHDNNIS